MTMKCDVCACEILPDFEGFPSVCGCPKEAPAAAPTGRKDDAGKERWSLLPWESLKGVVRVLTFGARKYAPDNWRKVPDARRRYTDAFFRHFVAWKLGEKTDPETGESHLSHALCCLLFIDALERENG